jgi:hypothetical protein
MPLSATGFVLGTHVSIHYVIVHDPAMLLDRDSTPLESAVLPRFRGNSFTLDIVSDICIP